MHAADLKQADEIRIGQLAGEMNAVHVETPAHLVQHVLLPTDPVRAGGAIADPVAANDDRMGVGTARQNLGQGTHERVIAAIGFQIAPDIGQHLIARVEHLP